MGAVGRVSGFRWVQRFVGYNVKFSLLVNRIFGPGKIDGRPCRVTRVQVCGCVLGGLFTDGVSASKAPSQGALEEGCE